MFIFRRLDKKLFVKFEIILKILDENVIEKLNFIILLENVLLKIVRLEIIPFF